jgi:malate dehydrogenase (oxaloacetate-decarboxylating)
MFMAAARALADTAPVRRDPAGALLPPLADSRRVARTIAIAVAETARREGLADPAATGDVGALVDARIWQPRYLRMKPRRD